MCFIDGISADRIVGFEELGGADDFSTLTLIRRFVNAGVLAAKGRKEKGQMRIMRGRGGRSDSDSGDADY